MTLPDFLSWSAEHFGTIAFLCLLVGAGGLLLVGVYRVALAVAQLRAWWHGGSFLRHPGGAGGHSEEYRAYMQSGEWRRRRGEILRRDSRRCRGCGGRATDVHHRWYSKPIGGEPDWALESLCEDCHQRAHGRG